VTGELVLFDVDGTLLLTHDEIYADANRAALLDVWGVAPDAPDVPGDTALAHTRRALAGAGLADEQIDSKLQAWCDAFSQRYVELLASADTSGWELAPGATDAIAALEHRALLTGNPEPVARARLDRLRLVHLFPPGGGAFGCEREERAELFELARSRAGDWPREQTVAVGDTPLDIAGAHAAGARCVAVTTGVYGRDELADADAVIATLHELPQALQRLDG
jgi:phosphoglycolate phosphatase